MRYLFALELKSLLVLSGVSFFGLSLYSEEIIAYLVEVDFRPEIGDIVNWNLGYFEINAFNENQLVAGQQSNSHSIIANTFMIRVANLNIEEVNLIVHN